MIWRLTSSSHCRCLSLLAMSSGVSPASLAKHTQKHRIHWYDTFYSPGRIRTSFASSHHILYSWLPLLDFILQTRQSQVYPDSLLTIDAGRDLREEIPWHRFTLPHTTARPHMALLSLLPIVGGQIVNNRTTTELQTSPITKLTSPSSQNKNMVWEHPPDQTRSLGILKDIMKGIPWKCHTQTSCFNRDYVRRFHLLHTDVNRGFSSQQQFETLAVVRQAAVMQRCASFNRLLIQV